VRCRQAAGLDLGSCGFRSPTPSVGRANAPVGATAGEVIVLADQALVELAGEQGNAVATEVMAKRTAGEADLLAAAGDQQGRIQLGPAFWGLEEG